MTTSRMRPDQSHDNPHHLIPDWLAEEIPDLYATDGVIVNRKAGHSML
jgi:hypothetical protein